MRPVVIGLRVLAVPVWLMFVVAMVSCFQEGAYGGGAVGLVLFVGPLGTFIGWPLFMKIHNRRRQAYHERIALRQRADHEHELFMWGDQRGVYGRFKPIDLGAVVDPVSASEHGHGCTCDRCSEFLRRWRAVDPTDGFGCKCARCLESSLKRRHS